VSTAPQPHPAEWIQRPERGSVPLVRFMVWLSLRTGRAFSRIILYPIMPYFFLTAARARANTRAFLRRALGREPTLGEVFRVFWNFSATIHDRVFFLQGRFDLFDVQLRGAELFGDSGALLMGAHLGSFEALRACGRVVGKRRVAMAMYEENARRLNAILASIDPTAPDDVVALGRVDSMIALDARLAQGDFVGMLADRRLGDEAAIQLSFLGMPAAFPTGPMRMAALLRRRVFFMAGVYRGGNRYEVSFEPLADFAGLDGADRAARKRAIEDAVRAYAARLEALARDAPDNWLNFHDFWQQA